MPAWVDNEKMQGRGKGNIRTLTCEPLVFGLGVAASPNEMEEEKLLRPCDLRAPSIRGALSPILNKVFRVTVVC